MLQLQGKLEEATTVGHRAVDIFRQSLNRDDQYFACGEKPVFIGLSLQDTHVVQVLSIDVFNCPFNSTSTVHGSPDMGILLALQLFECISSCCFIYLEWHGNGTNIAVRAHETISWFWWVSFPNIENLV